MTFDFIKENTASRHKLEAFVRGLSPADLARTTPAGWTAAALLAHLAYWDQRVLALLRRWQADGVDLSPVDADAVNDALKPLCLALEPQAAVELCLASARAVDAALVEKIRASENHFRFYRSLHRMDHLNEIEKLIAGA
jgi:hypothetical protein